jgi:hypothetical protein
MVILGLIAVTHVRRSPAWRQGAAQPRIAHRRRLHGVWRWAIAASGRDLFFPGVFVVPGALLGIAANGHAR